MYVCTSFSTAPPVAVAAEALSLLWNLTAYLTIYNAYTHTLTHTLGAGECLAEVPHPGRWWLGALLKGTLAMDDKGGEGTVHS